MQKSCARDSKLRLQAQPCRSWLGNLQESPNRSEPRFCHPRNAACALTPQGAYRDETRISTSVSKNRATQDFPGGPAAKTAGSQRREPRFSLCSVVSDSLGPHGLRPTRLLCPWDFSGKNTGVGCHLPHPETEPVSPALVGRFFTLNHLGSLGWGGALEVASYRRLL